MREGTRPDGVCAGEHSVVGVRAPMLRSDDVCVAFAEREAAEPDSRLAPGQAAALVALDKPYLKTSGKLKISQLRKYLSKKLKEDADDLELLCAGEGLAAEHSLHFIKRTLWPQPGVELVIHYRKNPNLKY